MRSFRFAIAGIVFFLIHLSAAFCQKRIAVIGSSSAFGYGLTNPAEESWVNRMKNYFMTQGIIASSTDVINLAETGSNCVTGMPTGYVSPYSASGFQTPNPAKNITAAINLNPKPNVVIVNYPSNGYDWMPLNDILHCFKTIYQTAEAAGVKCYITTTQPRNSFSPAERAKLKQLKDSITAIFGYYAMDFWTSLALPDNSQNPNYALDNVHPNAAGHGLLYNQVISKNIFGVVTAANPISGITLEAKNLNNKISLDWMAYLEKDNSFYDVEKSIDGQSFLNIQRIQGKGATSSFNSYSFIDNPKENGKIYYRIGESTADGRRFYSNVAISSKKKEDFYIQNIFPRVVHDRFSISISTSHATTITIAVSDAQCKIVKQQSYVLQKGSNTIDYPFLASSNGVYFVHIKNENLYKIEKVLAVGFSN